METVRDEGEAMSAYVRMHWPQGLFIALHPRDESEDRVCWCGPKIDWVHGPQYVNGGGFIVIHRKEDWSGIDL